MILAPLITRLYTTFKTKQNIESQLQRLLSKLKAEYINTPGYGGGNILNILCQLKVNLAGYDFSHLHIWQAYLQDVTLHQVNFAHTNLMKSTFAEILSGVASVAISSD
ncbi:MAG: hypothetical protein JOZ78_25470 [Chroococcidiopsidaceae cyanobacterium CP_BM_ER_R8_30]|nr:hypothetical protein [Chroococcidiopsidaceae cyanobacterium CP_BM_ER_R8_30]